MRDSYLSRARQLRKNQTRAENLLWMVLRAHRLNGYKFRRQQTIGPYIVDFVCMKERVIVEVDGGHHASNRQYDEKRTKLLRIEGFRVIRFWNNEVMTDIRSVAEAILKFLKPSPGLRPPSP